MLKSATQFLQHSQVSHSAARERIHIGCAGWQLPDSLADAFDDGGTQLARYAGRLQVVEVTSSFFRSHSRATWQRWRRETPGHFRFAVKAPYALTHRQQLATTEGLAEFLTEISGLEHKLGPVLFQLPPELAFHRRRLRAFFRALRDWHDGPVVCAPRHESWQSRDADSLLRDFRVARAGVHPRRFAGGDQPGGWPGLRYLRLNGTPKRYHSAYDEAFLEELEERLLALAGKAETWCIFNNTASDRGLRNALSLSEQLFSSDVA